MTNYPSSSCRNRRNGLEPVRFFELGKKTIETIELEIAEGKLGIARDRLQGLVRTYPENLQLRSRLGDVYWMLGYPREAGRFWFLDDPRDSNKQIAIDLFVRECRGDPAVILKRLDLRCPPGKLRQSAQDRIQAELDECARRGMVAPSFPEEIPTPELPWKTRLFIGGCGLAAFIVLALTVIGAATLIRWIFLGRP